MGKISKRPSRANRVKQKWERAFLGKTEDFRTKEEQKRERKHLKAYLRGAVTFIFGKDENGDPKSHKVKQKLINIT